MEKLTNKAARRYLRRVRGLLPCSRSTKDKITAPLIQSLGAFLAEQPEADPEALRTRFGAPEVIAASCLENTNTSELLRRLQAKRRVLTIAIAALIVILLTWIGFLMHSDVSVKRYHDGYYYSEVSVDSCET